MQLQESAIKSSSCRVQIHQQARLATRTQTSRPPCGLTLSSVSLSSLSWLPSSPTHSSGTTPDSTHRMFPSPRRLHRASSLADPCPTIRAICAQATTSGSADDARTVEFNAGTTFVPASASSGSPSLGALDEATRSSRQASRTMNTEGAPTISSGELTPARPQLQLQLQSPCS